jgi:hypothetical protein
MVAKAVRGSRLKVELNKRILGRGREREKDVRDRQTDRQTGRDRQTDRQR